LSKELHSQGGDADHNESGAVFRFILDSVYIGLLSEFRMVSIFFVRVFSLAASQQGFSTANRT
tara:strand:- start:634 stop:822 length:189 start_codon:yes stop_codon:yes gene_type:complete